MSFNEKYNKIYKIVSDDLTILEKELISDIDFSPFINKFLTDFLTQKAKRIRPLLSFLYLKALNKKINNDVYSYLTVIEIIHNASLIHDDVVDECDSRRGNDTINKVFNNKTAILTGDYLLSIALKKLNKLGNKQIIELCSETIENMCKGEINQYFNKFKIPTMEDYLAKTEQKTSKLFQTAILGSLILTGEKDLLIADQFAKDFGTAFQIRDDLLNVIQQKELKPTHNDIENGIYNAPVIYAQNIDNLNEGIEKTKSLLNNYVIKGKKHLENIDDTPYKLAIVELLDILNDT